MHNNPVNGIDPSGRSFGSVALAAVMAIGAFLLRHWVIVGLVALGVGIFFATRTYRRGLNHPLITDNDILNAIRSTQQAQNVLYEVAALHPVNWGQFIELLAERNTYIVGRAGEGVVGLGNTETAGGQQIIRYFENWLWQVRNRDACQHPSMVVFGNNAEFIQLWIPAEIQRLDIMLAELRQEAERRGILGDL